MRQDQLAGKATHSLTKNSVPELNGQPTYYFRTSELEHQQCAALIGRHKHTYTLPHITVTKCAGLVKFLNLWTVH